MSNTNGVDQALSEMRGVINDMKQDHFSDVVSDLEKTKLQMEKQILSTLKGSVAFEIIKRHLFNMLAEHEEIFKRFGKFESFEFGSDYCDAALASRALGRRGDILNQVEAWMKTLETV
jgi:hypothetical protein